YSTSSSSRSSPAMRGSASSRTLCSTVCLTGALDMTGDDDGTGHSGPRNKKSGQGPTRLSADCGTDGGRCNTPAPADATFRRFSRLGDPGRRLPVWRSTKYRLAMHLIAALQLNTGPDKAHNLEVATNLVRDAARAGATLVGLPETFNWMGPEAEREAALEPLEGMTGSRMASLARELKIHLLAGSILESGAPGGRAYNTSVLYGPGGERLAVYRKLHLFDVEIGDGATYRESRNVAPGDALALADTAAGKLGLSICYDLRFPELYRALSAQGAELLAVPAAFTLMTGKDHWEVLLRARAIENLCWVLA